MCADFCRISVSLTISNLLSSFIAYTFFDALCLTCREDKVKQYSFLLFKQAKQLK